MAERPGWRLAGAALVVLLALAAGAAGWTYLAEREASRGIWTHNPQGEEERELVVYHPGLSGYVPDMVTAYAEGLAGRGWRVETTTASPEAPENLDSYDLLVVAAPTYWWTPTLPVRRYVERISPPNERPVAVLVKASGQVERATRLLESQVEASGGRVIQTVPLTVCRPVREDDPRPNEAVAREVAREAGETGAERAGGAG